MMIPLIIVAMAIAALILLAIAAFVFMRCWIGCERDLIQQRRKHERFLGGSPR